MSKQITSNNSLAAHLGGGPGSQGGAQQGTGARGEQYLDGQDRSHTLRRPELFEFDPKTPISNLEQTKNYLTCCPFFRSKPSWIDGYERDERIVG
jgi:hypothetical protein